MHSLARIGAILGVVALAACSKKATSSASTDAGAAAIVRSSTNLLSTGLGPARMLDGLAAPTSTRWSRVVVMDGHRAIGTGESPAEASAILTDDEGKSWRTLRGDKRDWVGWSVAADGSIVLATGTREHAKAVGAADRPIDTVELRFSAFDGASLGEPGPVLPLEGKLAAARVRANVVTPALFSKDLAAFVVDAGKGGAALAVYGTPPGGSPPAPLELPRGERAVPVPFGRPPMMLTVRGGALLGRAFTSSGEKVDVAKVIGPFGSAYAELASASPCDSDEYTFQHVGAGTARGTIVGASLIRTVAIPIPLPIPKDARVGCMRDRVAIETIDPKTKAPRVVTCDLAGACVASVNAPFRPWPEPHAQEIAVAPTTQGVIAVLTEHDAARWGIYVAQSIDGGKTFELARILAEGTGDRGKVEVAAVVDFGKRVLLLLAGDLDGTSRRAFYALATDDGGSTWGPP